MRFLFLALHQNFCLEPPFPKTINEFKERISVELRAVDSVELQNVWKKLDYKLDVCRVMKVSHIELFLLKNKQTFNVLFISICNLL